MLISVLVTCGYGKFKRYNRGKINNGLTKCVQDLFADDHLGYIHSLVTLSLDLVLSISLPAFGLPHMTALYSSLKYIYPAAASLAVRPGSWPALLNGRSD